MNKPTQAGVSLVEVVIGVALIASVLVVISQLMTLYVQTVRTTQDAVVATYQAETALEVARAKRDDDWSAFAALPIDTPLYIVYGTSTVALEATNPNPATPFQTELRLGEVYRDNTTDDIDLTGGAGTYTDSDARVVSVVVQKDGEVAGELMTILTNVFEI